MGNNNLFKLMTLDATMKTSDIEERFEKIAKMLFESFAIQRVRQCISLKRLSLLLQQESSRYYHSSTGVKTFMLVY